MELFAIDEEVTALETTLSLLEGLARLPALIPLAWQLRQRDHRRALLLADEAEALLRGGTIDDVERQRGMARLQLVRGEIEWLFVDFDAGKDHARAAIEIFESLGDRIGAGDGKWLLAQVWLEIGDVPKFNECLQSAIEDYRAGCDPLRVKAVNARSLVVEAVSDTHAAKARMALLFDPAVEYGAQIEAWLATARGVVEGNTGNTGAAIKHYLHAHGMAVRCGNIRAAVVSAYNAADAIGTLGDLDTALEWAENASAQAHSSGYPALLALPQIQVGNVLRMLGRHADAKTVLSEALAGLSGRKNSQLFASVLENLADLSLDMGEPAAALGYFSQAERSFALVSGGQISSLRCWRGQAHALCRLARAEQASTKLSAALSLARREGVGVEEINVLRVYAELYRQSTLPPPDGMSACAATLHYLQQAMTVAAGIKDFVVPSEMRDEVASAYAARGEYQMAYDNAQAAARARESQRLTDARNRAIAMQVRQETERAHADAERQRQMAETEARRATALQESSATLETLGVIGREITASLNAEAVFGSLNQHVKQLLDATSFSVYLLEPNGLMLHGAFSVEAEKPLPLGHVSVDHPTSFSARCVRERQELVIDAVPGSDDPNLVAGTLRTQSLLFAPLIVGGRLIGVMSIQSALRHAYGERERAIFRTLCAYAAIALDNAAAYALAEQARQDADLALEKRVEAEAAREILEAQLRESQKMQAIGTLAGGIAHDFNNILATIIGNVELARQDVSTHPRALESLDEIRKAGSRARDLVQQILSFSRRQPTERKPIALATTANEAVRLLRVNLPARLTLETICAANVPNVLADATQIQQVVINLVNNAMQAIGGQPGHIDIHIDSVMLDAALVTVYPTLNPLHECHPGRVVRLAVSDDGCGMDAAMLERIFEPFYTTRQVDEGTGLGLSVVHGIVQTHEGAIIVESQPGKGSTFTVYLPATVTVEQPLPQAPEVKAPPSVASVNGGKHILYLDDDESLVFLVSRLLERSGHRISGHTDQREALDALRANAAEFDLVVTDYNMPGMSGLDVARAVRTIRADLPVAIASGFIDETLQSQAEGAGVRELIFKANAVEDLCEAFARLAQAVGRESRES